MTAFFDCLKCHAVTPVISQPPKCARCGCSTGVTAKSADGAVVRAGSETVLRGSNDSRGNLMSALLSYQRDSRA